MIEMDIATLVFAVLMVFFIGFHWGVSRRKAVAYDAYLKLYRAAEEEQDVKDRERLEAERERFREYMVDWEYEKEEADRAEIKRREKIEAEQKDARNQAQLAFAREFPAYTPILET